MVTFVPVVAIETYVLLRALHLSTQRSIRVSVITNAASTAVGIPLAMALGDSLLTAHFYRGKFSFSVHFFGQIPPLVYFHVPNWAMPVAMVILLLPLFLASWWIEYFVARLLQKGEQPVRDLRRAEFKANLASYVLPLLLMVGVGIAASREPVYSTGAFAVGSLRTINTAEITYASTYNTGYSRTLADLAPAPNGEPNATHAGLIDEALASGRKAGYIFTFTPGPPNANGRIETYTVSAQPLKYGETGTNSYFTDQSGVIRQTIEDRPATVNDPPVAG